jgi:hypothetical protein
MRVPGGGLSALSIHSGAALADRDVRPIAVSHGTVANVLLAAGLNTETARHLAASGDGGHSTNV